MNDRLGENVLVRQKQIEEVRERFAEFQAYVSLGSKNNHLDTNLHAQLAVASILNSLNGWQLSCTNKEVSNFPCIDLIDEKAGIGVQVTSDTSSSKVNTTLKCLSDKQMAGRFNSLKVFMLADKQARYTINKQCPGIAFDWRKDILDFNDLYRRISSLGDAAEVERIHRCVMQEFASSSQHMQNARGQDYCIITHEPGLSVRVAFDAWQYRGPASKPMWLDAEPTRMCSDWLVAKLVAGANLRVYLVPHWNNGILVVVDPQTCDGTQINGDQYRDLTSQTTTTTTTTPGPTSQQTHHWAL
jgi:hypothetical protein